MNRVRIGGCECGVRLGFLTLTSGCQPRPVGRANRVFDQGPAVVHALSRSGACRRSAGCEYDLDLSRSPDASQDRGQSAIEILLQRFDAALVAAGFLAMGGQIIDASIIA